MLEFEDASKNRILTRFTGYERDFNRDTGEIKASFFHTDKNMRYGEISVFDITDEVLVNNEEGIYRLGDKYVFPHTIARADVSIEKVRNIKGNNGNLRVFRGLLSKHRNIRPYPNSKAEALNIASKLARESQLHIRNNNL